MKDKDMSYEEQIHCFKKSAMQTMDLLVDSYKWKCLAECAEDVNVREKYRHISNTLEELYHEEEDNLLKRYRAE